jgi:hypothetical protein
MALLSLISAAFIFWVLFLSTIEVFSEIVQGSTSADIDTHLEQLVAILIRIASNRHRELRRAPILVEDESRERVGARRKHLHCEHEAFGRYDFAVSARKRVFPTVRGVEPPKCPVWPKVDFACGERDTTWVPPMLDMLSFGPGFEDDRARCIVSLRQACVTPGRAPC